MAFSCVPVSKSGTLKEALADIKKRIGARRIRVVTCQRLAERAGAIDRQDQQDP